MKKWIGALAASFALAFTAGSFVAPTTASAAFFEEGMVWDMASRTWIKPRAGSHSKNRMSDKSPIKRKTISFKENHPVGTIIVDTSDRRLYHVTAKGKALAYGIGVGREGFTWQGKNTVTRKAEWPGWTPPASMRARVKRQEGRVLPAYMPGGPNNPLGARALYIGSTIYRIHGTNQPWTIGQAMSSGCIRMANDDVTHLYDNVKVGARVIVRQ